MKRVIVFFIITVFTLGLAGCGTTEGNKPSGNTAGYNISGVQIVPGQDFAPMLEALGEPVKFSEAPSCYFNGMDKAYTYDGFEVRTYPKSDSVDYVLDLCITSDQYKTDKGITVGSSLEDVLKAYGEDYNLAGTSNYQYYYSDDCYMYFFVLKDAVKNFGFAQNAGN